MSSLKATQADGYYIPSEYLDAGKEKQYKKNNKGHNQYLTQGIVRFELPYDGFCLADKCRVHVAKGTRFNAKKIHSGDYFSTKIYDFCMKCRHCQHLFVIRTNPKEKCFDYISGIKKKVEEFDTVEAKSLGVIDTDYGHSIHNFTNGELKVVNGDSSLNKLEKDILLSGHEPRSTDIQVMEHCMKRNRTIMWNDADSNARLRAGYRVHRQAKKKRLKHATQLGLGKGIEVAESIPEDCLVARSAFEDSGILDLNARKAETSKYKSIRQGKLFKNKVVNVSNVSKNATTSRNIQQSVQVKIEEEVEASLLSNAMNVPKKKIRIVSNNGTVKVQDVKLNVTSMTNAPPSSLQSLLKYDDESDDDE